MARWRELSAFVEREFWSLRRSRMTTIADLTVGLLRKQQVGLAGIARGMVDGTTIKHRVKRLGRFAANEGIDPWAITRHLVAMLMPTDRQSRVTLDWTQVGEYKLLLASLVFQRRALPLAWCHVWDPLPKHSQNWVEEEFLFRLARLIGPERPWVLLADRGFGRAALFEHLNAAGIRYVIRVKDNVHVVHAAFSGNLRDLPRRPARQARYAHVLYHRQRRVPVHLVVSHREPAAEPWFLVTNLDARAREVERHYAKRMSIEEGIRDCKSGLGLKQLWLSEPTRMDRMMILVALAVLLIALTATASQARGERPQVTTSKKKNRPASYFTIGIRLLERDPRYLATRLELLHVA